MATDDDFNLPRREGMTPEERKFVDRAERIAREIGAMSDEEKSAHLKEHGLEHLVTPERIDEILRQAGIAASRLQ